MIYLLTATTDSTQSPGGNENGAYTHEQQIEGISTDCWDGPLICGLIDATEGQCLTGSQEEAAVLLYASIFSSSLHPLSQFSHLSVREEEFERAV